MFCMYMTYSVINFLKGRQAEKEARKADKKRKNIMKAKIYSLSLHDSTSVCKIATHYL